MDNLLPSQGVTVLLRQWIQDEAQRSSTEQSAHGVGDIVRLKKQSLLRKATVAYGAVELLMESNRRRLPSGGAAAMAQTPQILSSPFGECSVDNFVVHLTRKPLTTGQAAEGTVQRQSEQTHEWNNVKGVGMKSPALLVQLCEPSFLSGISDEDVSDQMGRYLEAEMFDATGAVAPRIESDAAGRGGNSDEAECRSLGIFLYELYSGVRQCATVAAEGDGSLRRQSSLDSSPDEPARKVSTVRYDKRKGKSYSTAKTKPYTTLSELGYPSSICLLVQNLIDGHDAYSLEAARSDMHLLLSDPDCFLFDLEDSAPQGGGGAMQIRIKKGKLYGRSEEVALITDAFCQVSSGKNAAIFIGGYSGSGKTMLVQSLTARVDINGGYVLTQKVDQMTKEKPLLGVLAAFNNLCLLIKEKCSPLEVVEMANKFRHDFESDYSVVVHLLPNMSILFPELNTLAPQGDTKVKQMMTLHNVCFTLQRFLRIVSSKLRPVMLFLDDLQWAARPMLDLVQALLTDTKGPCCFFFVGNYRDNEVDKEHPLLTLMSNLKSHDVETMQLNLGGLAKDDLNVMISEMLCVFPRLCKPLSDIVFEKTKSNPLFVLEFLKSLIDSSLLRYSLRERRWIWDEEKIRAESVTDNVLDLLANKMTTLPENVQTVLMITSCFGIQFSAEVLGYLSSASQYPDFLASLDQAMDEGFVRKASPELMRFVHDKVREAAYSLIPESNKSKFHHELGMLLLELTASKGEDMGGMIFQVVDQIIPSMVPQSMHLDIAKLGLKAGLRAMDGSDDETALSYFNKASLLLPDDHWEIDYEFSLQLYYLTARAAYSSGRVENACDSLKKIIEKGRSIEEKLDSYYLYATILHTSETRNEAYNTCREALSQLGEVVPDSVPMKELGLMIKETGGALAKISEDELLSMPEMQGNVRLVLKFYTLALCVAYWFKRDMMPYVGCRMIKLTLEHGVCQDSIFGLVLYSGLLCDQLGKCAKDILEASRIAKITMALFKKRFHSPEMVPKIFFVYYGFVACHTEPLQLCAESLRKGFEVGMSSGEDVSVAFYNSMRLVSTAVFCGEHLPNLLKQTDYHIDLAARLSHKLPLQSLVAHRETMSILIDKGESTSRNDLKDGANFDWIDAVVINLNRTLQSFWLGYSTRCNHYAKKFLSDARGIGRFARVNVLFYAAINAFRGIKNNNGNGSVFLKVKTTYKEALAELQISAEVSPWNYSNKLHLLVAEMLSFEGKSEEAKASYAAAITASSSSRFIHEQGLSCELAGLHYKKIGQKEVALCFFQKAKDCYESWGSRMKVDAIEEQMRKVQAAR